MTNRTLFLGILFIAFIISSCSNNPKYHKKSDLEGSITISGAFALYPITAKWAEEFMKLYPDVTIDVSAGGAGKGMTDALSGMVDLGMVSRPLSEAEISKGAWHISVVKDAVVPVFNPSNPYADSIRKRGLTQKQMKALFIDGKISEWKTIYKISNKEHIHLFTRSDACGAGEMLGRYLGKNQEALQGVGVFGDPGMADAVKNEPLSLGYNNIIYVYDIKTRHYNKGIEVVPLDLNENRIIDKEEYFYQNLDSLSTAIREGKFPSPPARELFFVSKGKPENMVVKEFLKWILTDGQQYVKMAGYVELSEKKRIDELSKVRFVLRKGLINNDSVK